MRRLRQYAAAVAPGKASRRQQKEVYLSVFLPAERYSPFQHEDGAPWRLSPFRSAINGGKRRWWRLRESMPHPCVLFPRAAIVTDVEGVATAYLPCLRRPRNERINGGTHPLRTERGAPLGFAAAAERSCHAEEEEPPSRAVASVAGEGDDAESSALCRRQGRTAVAGLRSLSPVVNFTATSTRELAHGHPPSETKGRMPSSLPGCRSSSSAPVAVKPQPGLQGFACCRLITNELFTASSPLSSLTELHRYGRCWRRD
nr:hypothetical protein Itr_chr14CG08730 [Ipomoea trifida]